MGRRTETLENHYPIMAGEPRCLWRFRKVQEDARRRLQTVLTPHPCLKVEPVMELAPGPGLQAYLNHNRWMVRCACENRQFVSPEDPRFFCDACYNAAVGHRLLRVVFPENKAEIDAEVERRPHDANRNWWPGISPQMLRAENRARGLR